MSVVVEEGPGFRVERGARGDTLVVVGQWNREAQTIIESGLVDGLDLNYAKGFKDVDLQFMKAWPIRRLELLARTVTDLSPLHRLGETLESVSIQSAESSRLDLGLFPHLTRLAADWPQVRETVHVRTSLVEVYLGGYRENDLRPLGPLTALESLTMKDRPSVATLAGAEEFTRLERLGLFGAPLGSLKGIEPLEQLRELQIEGCRVGDLTPLDTLRGLRTLNASDCGYLASLAPMRGLFDLESLWLFGTTNVTDGDLSPIADLPMLQDFRMKSRRSYRPSVREIQAQIDARSLRA